MNTRFFKWLLTVTVLFCLSFAATHVTAKKPIPQIDTCEESDSYFPAFVFWRDTGKRRAPMKTVYVASADGLCTRALIEIPWSVNSSGWEYLKFSYSDEGLGRVIWSTKDGFTVTGIWKQDFTVVNQNEIALQGSPVHILNNPTTDTSPWYTNLFSMDLSPDTKEIAFALHEWNRLDESMINSIRVLAIDDCMDVPCGPNDPNIEVLEESQIGTWSKSAWGPESDRLFVIQKFDEPAMQLFERNEYNVWNSVGILFTESELLEIQFLAEVANGYFEDESGDIREKLAIRALQEGDLCHSIYLIDVETCKDNSECTPESRFYGYTPSWTRYGSVLHSSNQPSNENQTSCERGMVEEWTGDSTNMTPLVEGSRPDAG